MIGTTLRQILAEKKMSVSELSRRAEVSAQTLYSILNRDNMKINLELLLQLCRVLQVSPERFYPPEFQADDRLLPEEWELLRSIRSLDDHGKQLLQLVLNAELQRLHTAAPERLCRVIPLYSTPAAAGYASPVEGADYTPYEVPAESLADFAARIAGDSMEPWLHDGDIALVTRRPGLDDGDVGLFFVDGDMLCKQYCRDCTGTVYLFSLNRERQDADRVIPPDSSSTICCYGKVILPKRPPLP